MEHCESVIRRERPEDYRKVEELTREAFWNVYRPGCTEHYIVHCMRNREEWIPELDLVMEYQGTLIGHILYTRAWIRTLDGRRIPVLTFGPLSIHPEYQRRGLGKILLDESMRRAEAMGEKVICIEGNPAFYEKSGFTAGSSRGIRPAGAPADQELPYFLVRELEAGFLDSAAGTYDTPEGYFVKDEEAEAFDAQFPFKEKLRLPGQLVLQEPESESL